MITKDDLAATYSKMLTSELLEILSKKWEYSNLAIEVAKEEILRRGITETDMGEYRNKKIVAEDEKLKRGSFKELTLLQKLLIYFLMPLLVVGLLVIYVAKDYLGLQRDIFLNSGRAQCLQV